MIVLPNHTSRCLNVVLSIHLSAKFSETLVEILVLKLLEAQQRKSLTMMIVQIDNGEFLCLYWLTTHQGP